MNAHARMEHRLFSRQHLEQPVMLYQRGRPIGLGHVRNVSRLGALVESETAPTISNGLVELELMSGTAGGQRLRAMLVHRSGLQFGVMLMDEWPVESTAAPRYHAHRARMAAPAP